MIVRSLRSRNLVQCFAQIWEPSNQHWIFRRWSQRIEVSPAPSLLWSMCCCFGCSMHQGLEHHCHQDHLRICPNLIEFFQCERATKHCLGGVTAVDSDYKGPLVHPVFQQWYLVSPCYRKTLSLTCYFGCLLRQNSLFSVETHLTWIRWSLCLGLLFSWLLAHTNLGLEASVSIRSWPMLKASATWPCLWYSYWWHSEHCWYCNRQGRRCQSWFQWTPFSWIVASPVGPFHFLRSRRCSNDLEWMEDSKSFATWVVAR